MRKELTHARGDDRSSHLPEQGSGSVSGVGSVRDGANRRCRYSQQATSQRAEHLDGVGGVPTPSRQTGKPLTQRAIDPFNTGGSYNIAALSVEARSWRARSSRSRAIRRTTSTTCLRSVRLIPVPMSKPGNARSRHRPSRAWRRAFSRNTRRILLGEAAHPSVTTSSSSIGKQHCFTRWNKASARWRCAMHLPHLRRATSAS